MGQRSKVKEWWQVKEGFAYILREVGHHQGTHTRLLLPQPSKGRVLPPPPHPEPHVGVNTCQIQDIFIYAI